MTTAGDRATSLESGNPHLDPPAASSMVLKRAPIAAPNYQLELFWALVLCLLLIIGALPLLVDRPMGGIPAWLQQPLGQLILTTLVQFWCGRSIFIDAVQSGWYRRRMNLNTLVAISTGAAYSYSLLGTFTAPTHHWQPALYYHICAVTIALTLWGRQLERRVNGKTKIAIQHGSNAPPQVVRTMQDRQEISIPIDRACEHQIVTVLPREVIPVDGVILAGESLIDR